MKCDLARLFLVPSVIVHSHAAYTYSRKLLLAVQSVEAPPNTRVTPCHAGRRHQSNLPCKTSLGRV